MARYEKTLTIELTNWNHGWPWKLQPKNYDLNIRRTLLCPWSPWDHAAGKRSGNEVLFQRNSSQTRPYDLLIYLSMNIPHTLQMTRTSDATRLPHVNCSLTHFGTYFLWWCAFPPPSWIISHTHRNILQPRHIVNSHRCGNPSASPGTWSPMAIFFAFIYTRGKTLASRDADPLYPEQFLSSPECATDLTTIPSSQTLRSVSKFQFSAFGF